MILNVFLSLCIATTSLTITCMDRTNTVRSRVLTNLSSIPHLTAEKDVYHTCIPTLQTLAIMAAKKEDLGNIHISALREYAVPFQRACKEKTSLFSNNLEEFKYKNINKPIKNILDQFAPTLLFRHNLIGLEFFLAHTNLTKEIRNKLLYQANERYFLKGIYLIAAWLTRNDFLEGSLLHDRTPVEKALLEHALIDTTPDKTIDQALANQKTPDELTSAMKYALHYNDPYALNLLIQRGATIPGNTCFGSTPLHLAAKQNAVDSATILLRLGADVNAKDAYWLTPLHEAVAMNSLECATILLNNGADVNAKDIWGLTPLHKASLLQSSDCRDILLSYGAEINAKTNFGETPLHFSAIDRYSYSTKIFLKYDAQVNARNVDNETPLHYAVKNNSLECAKILLSHGADVMAKNNNNETPIDMALTEGDTEMIALLQTQLAFNA